MEADEHDSLVLGAGADHWLISTQVDFTARGGGKDVVAVADYSATSATLTFPDGNAWTMVPCSNPNLKTAQQRAACALSLIHI